MDSSASEKLRGGICAFCTGLTPCGIAPVAAFAAEAGPRPTYLTDSQVEPGPLSLPNTPTAPGIKAIPNGTPTISGSSTVSNSSTLVAAAAVKGPSAPNGDMPNGAKAADINGKRTLADSLGGIVTNQAMTLAGQDFYSYFAEAWRDFPAERAVHRCHSRAPTALRRWPIAEDCWMGYFSALIVI